MTLEFLKDSQPPRDLSQVEALALVQDTRRGLLMFRRYFVAKTDYSDLNQEVVLHILTALIRGARDIERFLAQGLYDPDNIPEMILLEENDI